MLKDNERNDKQDEAMRMKRKEMKKKNERMKRGKKNVRVKSGTTQTSDAFWWSARIQVSDKVSCFQCPFKSILARISH